MERQKVLNEKTLVPIGALAVVFTFASYITKVSANCETNKIDLAKHEADDVRKEAKIDHELERINTKIDILLSRKR